MRGGIARVVGMLAAALSTACATSGVVHDTSCEGKVGSFTDIVSLAGRYRVDIKATDGPLRGQTSSGELTLSPRDSAASRVESWSGRTISGVTELYYGSLTIDLSAVGAHTEGAVDSRDASAPGVAVRRVRREGTDSMTIVFGAERTRAGTAILDGAMMTANIGFIGTNGFLGSWTSEVGPTTYRAGGSFCAVRD